ncbi:MAG: hypothetical protein J6A58_06710 [Oscillospiraceae bacterium]|nr:hypothetical protein [Oscillospiraceae bacterium]
MDEKILTLLTEMNERLKSLETDVSALKTDVSVLKTDVSNIKEEVSEIKEDTEITRTAVNTLIEWADAVSEVEAVVKFPVKKSS